MVRRLNLTGKNSNEIYSLHFPKNLLNFIKFDFTVFMERSTDLCRLYMKTGAYKQEEVLEVRNTVVGCHKFVEQNIRGVFDKIVVDCWIEYICRLNEIGTVTLWNNFIPCRTDFEKVIFSRLSEYRHNQAINQWVNILKIQEYAKTKTEFVFGSPLKNLSEAATKANYFDLMFNVAANELGYDVGAIAENKVYSLGRAPNSPFIMSSVSREIVRSMFSDMKYFDDSKHKSKKGEFIADQTAMDAFSAIKSYIPSENDLALGTMIKAMNETPQKVYIPSSFKAVVDLEIDSIIESDAVLQRCGRCKEYFLRSDEYDHDYCDRVDREGKSCIEIMSGDGISSKRERPVDAALLSMRCDQLYREMAERVNVDLTQRDFSDWYKYMMIIRDNVLSGSATLDDFNNFVEYSHSITFIPQYTKEKIEAANENSTPRYDEQGRVVKPFVFEKVDRRDIKEPIDKTETPPVKKRARSEKRDDFEPIYPFQQQNNPPRKIIRGVTAETYENVFNNNYVTIPYENEEMNTLPIPPRQQSAPQQRLFEDVSESGSFNSDNEADDIKIYTGRNEKPEPKREFVKVFEPAAKKNQNPTENLSPKLKPIPPSLTAPTLPEANKVIPAFEFPQFKAEASEPESLTLNLDSFLQNGSEREREIETERESSKQKRTEDRTDNLQRPENKVSYAANAYRNTGAPVQQETAKVVPKQQHQNEEEPAKVDFAGALLKGIERRDGFEENEIPTDAEGMPLSHKTKRVMDAIFKPSKPSLFLNVNRDE